MGGEIPGQLGNLVSIKNLDLRDYQVKSVGNVGKQSISTLPTELGKLSAWKFVVFENNGITGTIPSEYGDLSSSEVLWLKNEELSGEIPTNFAKLKHLSVVSLANNSLGNKIPSELGSLQSLEVLHLQENVLTGVIPSEVGILAELKNLDLALNNLSGGIPSEIGEIQALGVLDIEGNELTGTLPTELGNLGSLENIDLGDNELSGSIPSELGQIETLVTLKAGDNNFEGSVPTELGELELETIELDGNNITGYLWFACEIESVELDDINTPDCENYCGTPKQECNDTDLINATCSDVGCSSLDNPVCTNLCKLDYSTCPPSSDEMTFQLNIRTDNKGWESTWEIRNSTGLIWNEEQSYGNSSSIIEFRCLEKGCYTFELFDAGNDGLCCGSNNNENTGNYSIWIDGDLVENRNPDFGSSITHEIGDCNPTLSPTISPTESPSHVPSNEPTSQPSVESSILPTLFLTNHPSLFPTLNPTKSPSQNPSKTPSQFPSYNPTNMPTFQPSQKPSQTPTEDPSSAPSQSPTITPSYLPTYSPSLNPSNFPSQAPSEDPSSVPSNIPTLHPRPEYASLSWNSQCRPLTFRSSTTVWDGKWSDITEIGISGEDWNKLHSEITSRSLNDGETVTIVGSKPQVGIGLCIDSCDLESDYGIRGRYHCVGFYGDDSNMFATDDTGAEYNITMNRTQSDVQGFTYDQVNNCVKHLDSANEDCTPLPGHFAGKAVRAIGEVWNSASATILSDSSRHPHDRNRRGLLSNEAPAYITSSWNSQCRPLSFRISNNVWDGKWSDIAQIGISGEDSSESHTELTSRSLNNGEIFAVIGNNFQVGVGLCIDSCDLESDYGIRGRYHCVGFYGDDSNMFATDDTGAEYTITMNRTQSNMQGFTYDQVNNCVKHLDAANEDCTPLPGHFAGKAVRAIGEVWNSTTSDLLSYTRVSSGTCSSRGYRNIYDDVSCRQASHYFGYEIDWVSEGEYIDVVDGCSIRFESLLFSNPEGSCDPFELTDSWAYTGCQCIDWMPCLCDASNLLGL